MTHSSPVMLILCINLAWLGMFFGGNPYGILGTIVFGVFTLYVVLLDSVHIGVRVELFIRGLTNKSKDDPQ